MKNRNSRTFQAAVTPAPPRERTSFKKHHLLLARRVVASAALATLTGCGADTVAPLEIRQMAPLTIGARTPEISLWISGSGFDPGSKVFLGDVELALFGHSTTVLAARVPGGTAGTTVPGSPLVTVENSDGTRSKGLPLLVTEAQAPVLSAANATDVCGPAKSVVVTIEGDNFTTDTSLESNGQPVAIASVSRSRLSFSVPWVLGRYSFEVTVPPPGGGQASIGFATFLGCD